MAISSPGIGSNLDVNGIVSQLMALEQRPLATLAREEASYQAKLSAYGTLSGVLGQFQSALQALATPQKFQGLAASVADSGVMSASAGSSAVPASYAVEVLALAAQHKLHSSAFSSTTDVIGSGTITIQYGTYNSGANSFTLNSAKAAQSLTIGAANNTLSGVRDAINAAGIGVSATIVNDGTGNRLMLTSKDPGAANSLRITVADADLTPTDTAGLSRLAYDPTLTAGSGKNLTQALAAQDASLKVDGILVTKSSNIVTDAIDGVTLNLTKASASGVATTLSVSRDQSSILASVGAFVSAYNSLNKTINDLTSYNAQTKKGATLIGDGSVLRIQNGIRGLLGAPVAGLSGALRTLSDIGVAFQKDGSLKLDSAKLQGAISNNFDQLGKLFASVGASSDSLVGYVGASVKTLPGTYAVSVSQLATQGSLSGALAAGLTLSAGVNDLLALTIDGVLANVTLASGTPYASAAALAAEMQSKINGASAFASAGIGVKVTEAAGILTITSNRYGATSSFAIAAGAAHANLFGALAPLASAQALDAAGTIHGAPAGAQGQFLTAANGNAAEGLRVQILGGALGARGSISYTQGYAARLADLASSYLDPKNGAIASRNSGLSSSINGIADRREAMISRLQDVERRYRAQFSALDVMLSRMTQTSAFLTQQLASLNANRL